MKAVINENLFYLYGEYYLTEKRKPKYGNWVITDEGVIQRVFYNEYNNEQNIILASSVLLENCFYFKKPDNNTLYNEFNDFLYNKGLEIKNEYAKVFSLAKDFFKDKFALDIKENIVYSITFKVDTNPYTYIGAQKNIKGSGYRLKNYNYGRLDFNEHDDETVLGELIIDKIEYYEHIFA
jgi:hypothetical protein